jgi:phasin family protein
MQKNAASFFDTDITKYLAQFRAPMFDVDALMTAHRKNVEAVTAANQCAFEGVNALMRRQGEIAREAMESYSSAMKEMMSDGTMEEKAVRQSELARTAYDAGIARTRELTDLVAKTQDEAFGVINKRVREGLDEVQGLVAGAAKSADSAASKATAAVKK